MNRRSGRRAARSPCGPGNPAGCLPPPGAGLISGIRCRTRDYRREDLAALWLRAVWDGHGQADLELPFGCLFGNELGYHGGRCLLGRPVGGRGV